jgi:apolipoprotein N-acyltransferase
LSSPKPGGPARGRSPRAGPEPRLVWGIALRLVASAALCALAFPPFHLGPVILLALVPAFDAVRLAEGAPSGRRKASALLYAGFAFHFAALLYWILFLPPEETTVPGIIGVAFLIMVAYLGLFPFLAQWAARRAARAGLPIELALALAWVGAEYLRSQTQLGFPWVLLGYGLIETPQLLQFLSVTGIFGASLFVALTNAALYAALRRRGRARAGWAAVAVALPVAALLQGTWVMDHLPTASTREVLIVQGNIGRAIKFVPELRERNLEQLIAMSEHGLAEAETRPAVVVWPETAAPCYVRRDAACRARLERFVDESGVPLLTGAPDALRLPDGTRRLANAAVVLTPGRGLTGTYAKVRLVPFGEAIPYQERIPFLTRIDFGEADFVRGTGFTPVAVGEDTAGIMICFESIFPAIGRAYAKAGARYLINITNDEWFGSSGGPYQHAQMAIARAIETRRGLVRCANTGVSFVVDRAGRVTHATQLFVPAVVRAPVELGNGQTFYARIGDLLPALVAGATALAAFAGAGGFRDPRHRILGLLLGVLLVLALDPQPALGLALGLALAQAVHPAWRPEGRRFFAVALGLALFAVGLNALTLPGRALWTLGPLAVTAEGIQAGIVRAGRLVGLLALARIATRSLVPADLADFVSWCTSPFARIVPRLGGMALALGLAFRFVPEIRAEADRLRLAERARPRRAPSRGLALGRLEPYFLALLAGTVRRAEEVARTLDARGYGSGPRTLRFRDPGSKRGLALTFGLVAVALALLVAGRRG